MAFLKKHKQKFQISLRKSISINHDYSHLKIWLNFDRKFSLQINLVKEF